MVLTNELSEKTGQGWKEVKRWQRSGGDEVEGVEYLRGLHVSLGCGVSCVGKCK